MDEKDYQKDYPDIWLELGGDVTKNALDGLGRLGAVTLARWLDLVGNMPLSFQAEAEGRRFFFCHAGIDERAPLDAQDPGVLLWGGVSEDHRREATIVVGHDVWPEPLVTQKLIRTDTGACKGGPLTCVDVLSGRVEQSD